MARSVSAAATMSVRRWMMGMAASSKKWCGKHSTPGGKVVASGDRVIYARGMKRIGILALAVVFSLAAGLSSVACGADGDKLAKPLAPKVPAKAFSVADHGDLLIAVP